MERQQGSYRRHLQTAVANSAAPYGYTLTVWTSGAVTTHAHGIPTAWEALLLALGAVAGFALTAGIAHGRPGEIFASRDHGSVRLWGAFHLVPVGLSIAGTALVADAIASEAAWLVVGFVSTTLYLVVIAAQFTLADAPGR